MDSRNALFSVVILLVAGVAVAQTGDNPVTFKSSVNSVTVPVVVRDASGNVVSNLHKEDFTLLDNGAPVAITSLGARRVALPSSPSVVSST